MLRRFVLMFGLVLATFAGLDRPASADAYLPAQGGQGGGQFIGRCPANQSLVGLDLRTGDDIDAIRPICAGLRGPIGIEQALAAGPMFGGPSVAPSALNSGSGGAPDQLRCPSQTPVVLGMAIMAEGRNTVTVNSIALYCGQAVNSQHRPEYPAALLDPPHLPTSPPFVPGPQAVFCPDGQVAAGIHGRSGLWVDALGLICDTPRNSLGATITALGAVIGNVPPRPMTTARPGGPRAPGAVRIGQAGLDSPTAPSRATPIGAPGGPVGEPSRRTLFYGLQHDGSLLWYTHEGAYAAHAGSWTSPRPIAAALGDYARLEAVGANRLLAIRPDGSARLLRHRDAASGGDQWGDEAEAGVGFDRYAQVSGDYFGEVYALTSGGELVLYRPVPGGGLAEPRVVASGMTGVRHLIAGGDGALYTVNDDGTLRWREHKGHFNATPDWGGPAVTIASGWGGFTRVLSPGNGDFYVTNANGALLYYHVDLVTSSVLGQSTTRATVIGPVQIGTGWNSFKAVAAQWPS